MRWRRLKTLPIRPWYEVDDEECDLARQLLNDQFKKVDRERRALHRDWFSLLSRIHAVLAQEDRLTEFPAAIDEELDRLESMLFVGPWNGDLRAWADEYIANVGPPDPIQPP